jgi:hypothetical protein
VKRRQCVAPPLLPPISSPPLLPLTPQIPDASKPGEIVVHLQTVQFGAPYWIFALGPETYGPQGLYQYSIVSDPFKATLFVLARNVTDFYARWEPEVDAFLAKNGWDKVRGAGGVRLAVLLWTLSAACCLRAGLEQAPQDHAAGVHVLVKPGCQRWQRKQRRKMDLSYATDDIAAITNLSLRP